MANFDISGARFNEQLRMLETTDPVHADLMNAMFGQLIKNDVAMRDAVSVFAKTKMNRLCSCSILDEPVSGMVCILMHIV